jgi:ribonuclease P protein component
VLPAGSRLRRRADFSSTLRQARGVRGAGLLVAHVAPPGTTTTDVPETPPTQAGFVVSRAVGPAVTRNRVRRRLRHLVAAQLELLPVGSRVVVRALPASATASYAELDVALRRSLGTGRR